jgi:hypothetical protein
MQQPPAPKAYREKKNKRHNQLQRPKEPDNKRALQPSEERANTLKQNGKKKAF